MKWLPKWIGEIYSKLWIEYKETPFTFDDIHEKLGKYTLNYLSELKKAQVLFIFERKSKKRIYRLISPELYIWSYGYNINLDWLKQGVYAHIILKSFMQLKKDFGQNLVSMGIYGSVARNQANNQSDLDIFLVFQELQEIFAERLDLLLKLTKIELLKEELEFLNERQYYPKLSFYPRTVNELKVNFFTLDIAFDIKIIYDNKQLMKFLTKVHKKIKEQGIKRKYIDDSKYYLDLNLKFGDVFEFG